MTPYFHSAPISRVLAPSRIVAVLAPLLLSGGCASQPTAGPPASTRAAAVTPLPPRPAEGCDAAVQQALAGGLRRADERPLQLQRQMPAVPPRDANGRLISAFIIQFQVDTAGRVDPASVTVDTRLVAPFPEALRRASVQWRYRPAVLGACPVPFSVVDTMRIQPVLGPR